MSTLIAAAQARSIPLDGAECSVTGKFIDNPRRFGSINVEVSCGACPPAELRHLVQVAERGCLVASTLRQGLTVTASVKDTEHAGAPE